MTARLVNSSASFPRKTTNPQIGIENYLARRHRRIAVGHSRKQESNRGFAHLICRLLYDGESRPELRWRKCVVDRSRRILLGGTGAIVGALGLGVRTGSVAAQDATLASGPTGITTMLLGDAMRPGRGREYFVVQSGCPWLAARDVEQKAHRLTVDCPVGAAPAALSYLTRV